MWFSRFEGEEHGCEEQGLKIMDIGLRSKVFKDLISWIILIYCSWRNNVFILFSLFWNVVLNYLWLYSPNLGRSWARFHHECIIATASVDKLIKVWDVRSFRIPISVFNGRAEFECRVLMICMFLFGVSWWISLDISMLNRNICDVKKPMNRLNVTHDSRNMRRRRTSSLFSLMLYLFLI